MQAETLSRRNLGSGEERQENEGEKKEMLGPTSQAGTTSYTWSRTYRMKEREKSLRQNKNEEKQVKL